MVDYYCMFLPSFYQLIEHQLNILHIYILLQDILNLQCHMIFSTCSVAGSVPWLMFFIRLLQCLVILSWWYVSSGYVCSIAEIGYAVGEEDGGLFRLGIERRGPAYGLSCFI
jgi:hypothetical protein